MRVVVNEVYTIFSGSLTHNFVALATPEHYLHIVTAYDNDEGDIIISQTRRHEIAIEVEFNISFKKLTSCLQKT
jgi:hypothetical protein